MSVPTSTFTSFVPSPVEEEKAYVSGNHVSDTRSNHEHNNVNIDVGSAMIYSSVELLKATDNFNVKNEVGRGGFGVVYRAKLRLRDVAVKKLTEV